MGAVRHLSMVSVCCLLIMAVHYLSPLSIIVKHKHAHELLDMIVEHGVEHARIDIVECVGNDRVARDDV